MSTIFACVSDLHTNSKTAVCPPSVTVDGGTWRANKIQHFLWANFCDYWAEVGKLAGRKKKRKKPLIVVINGEITDGDHHGSTELIAPRNVADRVKIALATLEPMLDLNPDEVYITAGTEVHSGKGSQEDEIIGMLAEIGAVPAAEGKHIHNHLLLDVGGVLFDIAHHGRVGQLPWTGAAAVFRYAVELELLYHRSGERMPDVAIRSHMHTAYDSYDNAQIRVLATCGWQYPTQFVNRIAPGKMPDVGGLIFECEKGQYELWKKPYKPLPRKPIIAGSQKKKS